MTCSFSVSSSTYYCLEDDRPEAESNEEKKDENKTDDTTTTTNDDVFPEHTQQHQQAYLEPILVAMELGQEILQGSTGDDEQATVSR